MLVIDILFLSLWRTASSLMIPKLLSRFNMFLINMILTGKIIYMKRGIAVKTFGYVSGILAAVTFGSVSTIAKPVVSSVNPLLLSLLVYLIASATLSPIAIQRKNSHMLNVAKKEKRKKDYFLVVVIALAGGVIAPSLYFAGLQQTSASNATLLANSEIIFTVAIAIAFFEERLRAQGYVGTILVLAGVIITTTNLQIDGHALFSQEMYYGNLLILVSTLFWAIDNNLSKVVAQRIENVAKIVQLKGVIGGALLLVVVGTFNIPPGRIGVNQIIPIILLGSVGFGGSLYFFLEALKCIGTVRTVLLFSLSSVFGLLFAAVFLREQVSVYQMMAAVIILFGIYMINRKDVSQPVVGRV